MEDVKKTAQGETVSNTAAAAKAEAEQLKEKYKCKVYRVGITIPQDDSEEKEFAYYFKRPAIASYDRYLKSAAQRGHRQSLESVYAGLRHRGEPRRPDRRYGGISRHRRIGRQPPHGNPRPDQRKFEDALRERVTGIKESVVELGLIEIYRFLPRLS